MTVTHYEKQLKKHQAVMLSTCYTIALCIELHCSLIETSGLQRCLERGDIDNLDIARLH